MVYQQSNSIRPTEDTTICRDDPADPSLFWLSYL
jgi:hypothetical protein